MFHTIKKAKQKWCPFADASNRNVEECDDPGFEYMRHGCIGDECMLWQWADPAKECGYCGMGKRP